MTRFQCSDCGKQLDTERDSDEHIEKTVRDGRIHVWIRLEKK